MMLHESLYTYEVSTIYMHLHVLEILHEHNLQGSSSTRCRKDKLLLKKPKFKKKIFLARAFRVRAIEIWNNLNGKTKSIASRSRFNLKGLQQP